MKNKKQKNTEIKIRKGCGIMGTRAFKDRRREAMKKACRKKVEI